MTAVPRVLSTRELAEAVGVSESSIKRWADEGRVATLRTAGGHRRIAVTDAVRFVRGSQLRLLRPEILGLDEVAAAESKRDAEDDAERLRRWLENGAAAEARGLVLGLYLSGKSVASIVDGPVSTAMQAIGELWTHSAQGIFLEHRATDIVLETLRRLRGLLPLPSPRAPLALGGAPAGDPYTLASLAAAVVVESLGYSATNLGSNTPVLTLMEAAEALKPRLVWLSVGQVVDVERLRLETELLAEWLAPRGAVLTVGGRGTAELGLKSSPVLRLGRSLSDLESLALEILPPSLADPEAGSA